MVPRELYEAERAARRAAQELLSTRTAELEHANAALLRRSPSQATPQAATLALDRLSEAQALALDIQTALLQSDLKNRDAVINDALARISRFADCDRAFVFRARNGAPGEFTHAWAAPGVASISALPKDAIISTFAHWHAEMVAGTPILLADVAGLPEGSPIRTRLEHLKIRSLLIIPVVSCGRIEGALGLDSCRSLRSFHSGEVLVLRLIASLIDKLINGCDAMLQLEAALAELGDERARLAATLAAMPDLVLELDAEGIIRGYHAGASDSVPDMLDPWVNQPATLALPPDIAPEGRATLARIAATGQPEALEFELDLGHGRRRLHARGARALDRNGALAGFVLSIRDISQAYKQQKELARLSEITRRSTNLVVITDEKRRIVWTNLAFEKHTGYSLNEISGITASELLLCPETDMETVARIRGALEREEVITAELLNKDRWGARYWVRITIQPLHNEKGELTGFMAVQTDISKKKAQEIELARVAQEAQEARETLMNAVAALDDGFAYFNAEDKLVLCNMRYASFRPETGVMCKAGLSFETLLRADIAAGYRCGADEDSEAYIAEALAKRSLPETTTETQMCDGRWVRITERRTPDGGRVETIVDITTLKEAESRALSERAEAMDASRDGIALYDPAGEFIYMNPAHLAMFGYGSIDEVRGLNWRALCDPADIERLKQEIAPMLAEVGFWQGTLLGRTRDGTSIEHEATLTRRPDGGFFCISRDITNRRRAEAERARLAADLEQALRREMIGQMAASLSHDFNNLLATISGSANLLENVLPHKHPALRHVLRILAASDQASSLVNRILNLGRRKSSPSKIDLRDPLREAVDLARVGLPASVRLVTDLPNAACEAVGDPIELLQIVLNLVLNARDAVKETGGMVRVSLALADNLTDAFGTCNLDPVQTYYCLSVTDDGSGMTKEVAAQAFLPYFTTKGEEGSGLGLASVKSLVTANGGSIRLTTTPGDGTRFDILWPAEPPSIVPRRLPEASAATLAGRRIMIVDDSEEMIEVLKSLFKDAGAMVSAATDPLHALEALADDPQGWDLVITDYDMPGATGADIANHAAQHAPNLPVILLTAIPKWQARSHDTRFAAILGKPASRSELITAAKSVLSIATAKEPQDAHTHSG